MRHRSQSALLLSGLALLMVLGAGSCARKRKPLVRPAQRASTAVTPSCAIEVNPATAMRGERVKILARANTPGFADGKVAYQYRWEIKDASGRPAPVTGDGATIEIPTDRLACGAYEVSSSVSATADIKDCPDCITTGQTNCTATFAVSEPPCPEVTCDIQVESGVRPTFHATWTGNVENPTFIWTTSRGKLSSNRGDAVTFEGAVPSSATVTVMVETSRTRCGQLCPSAGSSISFAASQRVEGLPLERPRIKLGSPGPRFRQSRSATAHAASEAGGEAADIDTQLERLKRANIVFNTPETMRMDETRTIQLLLGLSSVPELEEMIQERGQIQRAENIRISNQMEAKLSGPDFSITEVTPSVIPISLKEVNEWKWNIKPEKADTLQLTLALNVILFVEGNQRPRTIKTFERKIEVTVVEVPWSLKRSILDFIKSEWKWLWTVLVLPLFGWLWKRFRKPAPES